MQIDHAGIATPEAERLADLFVDMFGCELVHEETRDGMLLVFLDFGNGYFELIEPLGESGPIAGYLERKGAGIHHLAMVTDDIEAALDRAQEHGAEPIDDVPREGAWGHRIAFFNPESTGGILLELVEH